jgi:hypothetical protein
MREFPQPEDFPPPPLYPYVVMTLIVFAVLGAILFHPARKARPYDALCWLVAAYLLTPIFTAGGREDFRIAPALETGVVIMWCLMAVGGLIGWVRLVHQKEEEHVVISILLLAALPLVIWLFTPVGPMGGVPTSRTVCKNNMHLLGLVLYNYRDEFDAWPLHVGGDPPHSWRVDLLPYLDQAPLHGQYDFTATWDSEANRAISNREIFAYHCPSHGDYQEGQPFPTSYALLIGDEAAWTANGFIEPDDIPDGASNTAILTEACGLNIIWTDPRDVDLATAPIGINLPGDAPGRSPGVVSSYHPLGPPVLMADGSVRNLKLDTDPAVLKALLTANGGEDLGEF